LAEQGKVDNKASPPVLPRHALSSVYTASCEPIYQGNQSIHDQDSPVGGTRNKALQNALLTATQKEEQLSGSDKRWPWLCRIVIQHCHLLGRQNKRWSAELSGSAKDGSPTSGEKLEKKELGEIMRRLLHHLPEQQRTAVTLKHIEQMDYVDIARIMALAESTARAHVRAGRQALRKLILSRHPEWQV